MATVFTSNLERVQILRAPVPGNAESLLLVPTSRVVVRGALPAWRARRALEYVERNLSLTIKVIDVARHVNMCSSHFSRAFKRTFGITVHAYLMCRRVDAAKTLIASTPATLSDIAVSCGLTDQSHMTRWFRRIVGMTPGSWRRTARASRETAGSAED
jgi:AraC-like DNA-binding protein